METTEVERDMTCIFCGESLVQMRWGYQAPARKGVVRSVDGVRAAKGECLTAAGLLTCHEPRRA